MKATRNVNAYALLLLAASACGSSPEPIYYAMTPSRDERPASAKSWAHVIELRKPAIAGYLDRGEIVASLHDHRIRVASGDSWGEPFGDMTGRVLAENLSQRLQGSVVFSESSPISATPDAIVSLDVRRFDAGPDGTVTLRVEIAVERSSDHTTIVVRNIDIQARPRSTDTASLVATMSDLLAQLADQVAPYLVAA